MELSLKKPEYEEGRGQVSVYLPSKTGAPLVIGDAIITKEGDMAIFFHDKDMVKVISSMMEEGLLKGVSFDYADPAVPNG